MVDDGKTYRVGSRKSELAMIQTNIIVNKLIEIYPYHKFKIIGISTIGDKILDIALSKIGEKSLFTKELETALLRNEVDFVVHSLKDVPTILPTGLTIAAIPKREDPRDAVLLSRNYQTSLSEVQNLSDLPNESVIGTSSPRRIAQLRHKYPQLNFLDIRGNLNTRLKKLDDPSSRYTAILLAIAGIKRMGWDERITFSLEVEEWKYAVGQGALGIECASINEEVIALLEPLNNPDTYLSCIAERNFLRTLEGGCSIPVGVKSTFIPESSPILYLSGVVYNLDGSKHVNVHNCINLYDMAVDSDAESTCDMTSVRILKFPGYHQNACFAAGKLGRCLGEEALLAGGKEIMNEVQEIKSQE